MRISSGISQQPPAPPPLPPRVLDYVEQTPHGLWMRALSAGATFAAGAALVEIVWDVLVLAARVRGYPEFAVVRAWQPMLLLSQAALQWVAAWILTTDDPSPRDRPPRLFAGALRLSVTVLFLLLSADALRLYEGMTWQSRSSLRTAAQLADLVATLLFWPYLLRMALRLSSPDLAVRAGVGLVASVVSWGCVSGPRLLARWAGISLLDDRYSLNLAYGTDALCSTLVVLMLLRFTFRFRDEASVKAMTNDETRITNE